MADSLINAASSLDDEDFIFFIIGTFKSFPIDEYVNITKQMIKNPELGKKDESQ